MSEPRILPAAEIEALARRAGFDLCGFARPEPIPPSYLGEWLAAGMCADMDWLTARAADRLDVRRLRPDAKTVLALACNYYVWKPELEDSPISRYARGRDYHNTLQDRLRALRRFLREAHPDVQTYAEVDFGPVMERIWAVRAGLGGVARNGMLYTERFGSWVFLAAMVLDVEVDRYADSPASPPPIEDLCAGCTLCMSECPTGAIVADRTIDARLCLSYQTIENENDVPEELRPAFENVVFGCDICQQVCPLNAQPVPTEDARFIPRAVASLGVREIAAMTHEQYAQLIPGTPLGRAKYDGLRRNATYALGAMRDEGARELLQRLVEDQSEKVRTAARWALEQLDRS